MDYQKFKESLSQPTAPPDLGPYLSALWEDGRGDWSRAHEIVQDIETADAASIHAYLHRKEGDESNARYWYRTAGRPFPSGQSLDEEWRSLTLQYLK
jgi:hypothetical protein